MVVRIKNVSSWGKKCGENPPAVAKTPQKQGFDSSWDKLPACHVCTTERCFHSALASWKLTPRKNTDHIWSQTRAADRTQLKESSCTGAVSRQSLLCDCSVGRRLHVISLFLNLRAKAVGGRKIFPFAGVVELATKVFNRRVFAGNLSGSGRS